MSDEMKPCPFCNSTEDLTPHSRPDVGGDMIYWVECDNCGASGPTAPTSAAWNRRGVAPFCDDCDHPTGTHHSLSGCQLLSPVYVDGRLDRHDRCPCRHPKGAPTCKTWCGTIGNTIPIRDTWHSSNHTDCADYCTKGCADTGRPLHPAQPGGQR